MWGIIIMITIFNNTKVDLTSLKDFTLNTERSYLRLSVISLYSVIAIYCKVTRQSVVFL